MKRILILTALLSTLISLPSLAGKDKGNSQEQKLLKQRELVNYLQPQALNRGLLSDGLTGAFGSFLGGGK